MSKKRLYSNFLSSKSLNFPLYALCLGLAAMTVLAAGFTFWLLERNQRTWTYEYGQALANLSAHRALDSTLNHDLVSLQVILSDVAENISVVNATIHDVENNLLVQAGRRSQSNHSNRYANFSAPITLHNSIAGYVTITLDLNGQNPFQGQLLWLFGLLIATLIALTLCYAYFSRSKLIEQSQHSFIPIVKSPSALPATRNEEETGAAANDQVRAHLMLCLQNYQELSRQLNSKSFRSLNQRLEQQVAGVLALYGGKILHADQDLLHLHFNSNESQNDAVFKGLCASLLLLQLNAQPTSTPLQLTALLYEGGDSRNLLKRLPYYLGEQEDYKQTLRQLSENTLVIQNQLLEDPILAQRVVTTAIANNDDLIQVISVQQNYQDLLDKQLQQLSKG